MNYLIWCLPALVVVGLVSSGRVKLSIASTSGAMTALLVGLVAAPQPYHLPDALLSTGRGVWIGLNSAPYIIGGLFFWRMALRRNGDGHADQATSLLPPHLRRRSLFSACFLVGPFAEAATGFGAGIFGVAAVLRNLDLAPRQFRVFALLSQTLILWGAMGSGLVIAGAYANIDPTALALTCTPFVVIVQLIWLPLYWRLAHQSGICSSATEMASEAVWLSSALAAVIAATWFIGAEIALLVAFGPLIALRWLIDQRPSRTELLRTARHMLPFAVLIGLLCFSRMYAPLHHALQDGVRLAPFANAPVWLPLFHAGSWLIAGGLLIGLFRCDLRGTLEEVVSSWRIGGIAVLAVILFSVMAELLSGSGIASALGQGVYDLAGRWALLATPLLTGSFGILTSGGNAPNGLFMASQVKLGELAGLSIPAVIALQHYSGSMASMFSPVRLAIICGLAGTPGQEREAYRDLFVHILGLMLILIIAAALICFRVV